MNKMNILLGLVILSFTAHFSSCQNTTKGAYAGSDVTLPCQSCDKLSCDQRDSIWWLTNGILIGTYTESRGYEPSGHPNFTEGFSVISIEGGLVVDSVQKGVDDRLYECGITLNSGENQTSTVLLEIGTQPGNIQVITNGTRYDECFEHVGLGPMSCSVLSDPQANINWTMSNVPDEEECATQGNLTCLVRPDGLYNCTSTIDPVHRCFGRYECHVQYELEDLMHADNECIIATEYTAETLRALWISLLVIGIVIFIVVICGVLMCCGVVSAGAIGAVCACCACCEKYKDNDIAVEEIEGVYLK